MSNSLRLLTAIAGVFTGTLVPAETAADRAPTPVVVLSGMTVAESDAAHQMIALFAQAGLELPAVTIRRHPDTDGCNGHDGLHRIYGDRSEIDICTVETDDAETRVILHELSHAWAFHYLTPEHKAAFKQLRGWDYWLDYDHAEWKDNGNEQAAEIMVWALSGHPVHVNRIDQNTCAELHDGYVALTGLEPLHGFTDRCDGSSKVQRS